MTTFDFNHLPLTGWYPGHMLKAGRRMQEALKLIDAVVELVDARAPASTHNPHFGEIVRGKPHILVVNKVDLADPDRTRAWERWFAAGGRTAFLLDSRHARETERLVQSWKQVVQRERRRRGATRPLNRPVRVMIAGIPNVGKSTLVNRLYAGRRAEVGPKPGVTRHNQWTPLRGGVELLDTPGVLWPHIRNKEHELRLALLGCIRDEVMEPELIAEFLWAELVRQPSGTVIWQRYGLSGPVDSPEQLFEAVARRRGLLRGGGVIDRERVSTALLKDFRTAKLGEMTLECPPEAEPSDDAKEE